MTGTEREGRETYIQRERERGGGKGRNSARERQNQREQNIEGYRLIDMIVLYAIFLIVLTYIKFKLWCVIVQRVHLIMAHSQSYKPPTKQRSLDVSAVFCTHVYRSTSSRARPYSLLVVAHNKETSHNDRLENRRRIDERGFQQRQRPNAGRP